MSVYFAKVGRYIKVGYSENPERRVHCLFASTTRYSAPRDISSRTPRELLAAVPGRLNEERAAHAALDDFRVRAEWFLDEPEVREYIAATVASGTPSRHPVKRPAGPYFWDADPILAPDLDAQRAVVSAALAPVLGHSP